MLTLKKSQLALAVLAATSGALHATEITILDENGQPVVGVEVHEHASHKIEKSNEQGVVVFDSNQPLDLHFDKANYIPLDIDVAANEQRTVTLKRSAIESITVTSGGFHKSSLKMAQPVSTLSGEALLEQNANTLGDTLDSLPGIHSSFFGGVASSPVIRGLDGPRVKITQNGLDSADVSRGGPDHLVTAESLTATQVEVLKGPATLLYGSGAIGGVVNVVDNRIPLHEDEGSSATVDLSGQTVSDQKSAAVVFDTGVDDWRFHFDGLVRDSKNYELSDDAELEGQYLENSDSEAEEFTIGTAYHWESGVIGASYGRIESVYGIPGHDHDAHDDHGDEHGDDHDEDGHDDHAEDEHDENSSADESVKADLKQDRFQFLAMLEQPIEGIEKIELKTGYTDYEHVEIDHGEIATKFENETLESRLTVEHENIFGWHGIVGLQFNNSEQKALGAEAFTPDNDSESISLFILEEKQAGDFTFQLGYRVEFAESTADNLLVHEPHDDHDDEHHDSEDEHHDDEDEHHDDEDEHHDDEDEHHDDEDEHHDDEDEHHDDEDEHHDAHGPELIASSANLDQTNHSFSAGVVYDFAQGYNLALNLTHAERTLSGSELFSNGLHIATNAYEIGAWYQLDEHGHLDVAFSKPDKETSNNIDIVFRKFEGDFGVEVSLFYNQVDNFSYQSNSEFVYVDGEIKPHDGLHDDDHGDEHDDDRDDDHGDEHDDDHGDEHDDDHGDEHDDDHGDEHDEHADELAVLLTRQQDATLYGFEASFKWQIDQAWSLSGFTDYTKVELDDGSDAPRIPPLRFGSEAEYKAQQWRVNAGFVRYNEQDNIASYETKTDGYTLYHAAVFYDIEMKGLDITLYGKGENLTDENAVVHSSYIKNDAPLPGRNWKLGVRAYF